MQRKGASFSVFTNRQGLASWQRSVAELKRRGFSGVVCLDAECHDTTSTKRLLAEEQTLPELSPQALETATRRCAMVVSLLAPDPSKQRTAARHIQAHPPTNPS